MERDECSLCPELSSRYLNCKFVTLWTPIHQSVASDLGHFAIQFEMLGRFLCANSVIATLNKPHPYLNTHCDYHNICS
jgi:hypothetical protein